MERAADKTIMGAYAQTDALLPAANGNTPTDMPAEKK